MVIDLIEVATKCALVLFKRFRIMFVMVLMFLMIYRLKRH